MPETSSAYAGRLVYKPRLELTDETKAQLRQGLVQAGLVQEPENADIVIDWYTAERDAQNNLVRQIYTLVYRDGGDTEPPAVLFYRLEKNRATGAAQEYVHIPDVDHQPALADTWHWWEDRTGEKLRRLNAYLQSIPPEGGWLKISA